MTDEFPDDALIGAARQYFAGRGGQQPQGWRPACTLCLNGHKLAIAELTQKLGRNGLFPGSQEFMQAIQAAARAGQAYAQDPIGATGLNGDRPDMIPPVRPADVFAGGTSYCAVCFVPQKQTSLLAAPSGWTPSGG